MSTDQLINQFVSKFEKDKPAPKGKKGKPQSAGADGEGGFNDDAAAARTGKKKKAVDVDQGDHGDEEDDEVEEVAPSGVRTGRNSAGGGGFSPAQQAWPTHGRQVCGLSGVEGPVGGIHHLASLDAHLSGKGVPQPEVAFDRAQASEYDTLRSVGREIVLLMETCGDREFKERLNGVHETLVARAAHLVVAQSVGDAAAAETHFPRGSVFDLQRSRILEAEDSARKRKREKESDSRKGYGGRDGPSVGHQWPVQRFAQQPQWPAQDENQ